MSSEQDNCQHCNGIGYVMESHGSPYASERINCICMNEQDNNPERTAMQEALIEIEAIRLEQKQIWKDDPKLSGYPVDILDTVFSVVKMKLKELSATEKNQWSKAYAQGILVYHPDPCKCFSCVVGREGQGQVAYNEKYGTDGK